MIQPRHVGRFPKPLRPGDLIAVTAPSSGVTGAALQRLDIVLAHLRALGYRVIEGMCLRQDYKDASAPPRERATELMRFLTDEHVSAILPPWGGTLASQLLELIDFIHLRSISPKWFLGYSDLSTLLVPLTLISGWATAHGSNLMDLSPAQTDTLTTSVLKILASDLALPIRQYSSTHHQRTWNNFEEATDAAFALTETTLWRRLDGSSRSISFRGRLVGGCLDTIAWLAGSEYADIPNYVRMSRPDGTVLYFENAGMAAHDVLRALLSVRRHGWLDGLSGMLIGRTAMRDGEDANGFSYDDALHAALDGCDFPILYEVDIGHLPPQMTLINGCVARIEFSEGRGFVDQQG